MKSCVTWALLSLLCLVRAEEDVPLASDFDMYQQEVKFDFPGLQREVDLSQRVQGQPALIPLIPRGRSSGWPSGDLNGFPPGKPNRGNIGNLCRRNRPKVQYGPENLPQTGYSHLGRQGDCINEMEEGYLKCCYQPDKVHCAVEVWKNAMDHFCEEEFRVKTRHYHCCKMEGSERETCFINEAPNPSYISSSPLQEMGSAEDFPSLPRARALKSLDISTIKYKLSDLAFPPGEPKASNIQNICKLRKFRPLYNDNMLPTTSHGHYERRAKAITRAEKEFKKCCQNEDVACAQRGWKKALSDFCSREGRVKTRQYPCCLEPDQESMFSCFAREAPFPEYDQEIERLNLGDVSEEDLEKICKESKLLTKQKQIPLLVSGLKESCCNLPQDKKPSCAQEQKEKFIEAVCGTKKDLWKDNQNCCGKDGAEREKCFSTYLQISLAISQRTTVE